MWFILGILSGLFNGLAYGVSKKALGNMSPVMTSIGWTIFSLPYLLIALLWSGWASTNFTFWWATILSAVINAGSFIILMRALKISDLSLTIPFLSFTPLFLLFVSKAMLGEFPTNVGLLGVLILVTGAYILQLKEEKGILGPFRALSKNKGTQLMLAVAFLYAIISTLNKIAVVNSNQATYLIVYQGLAGLMLFPLVWRSQSDKHKIQEMKGLVKPLALIGLLEALTLMFQMTAVKIGLVSYVISLKRTSAIWSVLLGIIIFHERNITIRFVGAVVMVAGVVLISQG